MEPVARKTATAAAMVLMVKTVATHRVIASFKLAAETEIVKDQKTVSTVMRIAAIILCPVAYYLLTAAIAAGPAASISEHVILLIRNREMVPIPVRPILTIAAGADNV
jgi:hypothetical protein